jgi:glycosyltransferase involved in cell wall biosynthesis
VVEHGVMATASSGTSARARVLFVTPVSPFAGASGAQQRSRLMHEALSEVFDVDVLQLHEGGEAAFSAPALNAHGGVDLEVSVSPKRAILDRFKPQAALTREVERRLGRALSRYDMLVGRYLWPVCQLECPAGVPVLADLDDWRYRYAQPLPTTVAALRERLTKAVAFRLAQPPLSRLAGAFTVSRQDGAELSRPLPTAFLPNVPSHIPDDVGPAPADARALFVGSLWYRPNAEGVDWLLGRVWPIVRARMPQATLLLVGAAPAQMRQKWEQSPGVSAPGFVDDLAQAYREARAVVVPIHTGGGTNIKVLEAMAHGRACIVTSFIHQAFGGVFEDQAHLLVGAGPERFAAQLLRALQPADPLDRLAANARSVVQRDFTPHMFKNTVQSFATQVLRQAAR